jgi:hypothetical protein
MVQSVSNAERALPTLLGGKLTLASSVSRIAFVNYYRCPECQQVWTVTKDGSRRILDYVTNLASCTRREAIGQRASIATT